LDGVCIVHGEDKEYAQNIRQRTCRKKNHLERSERDGRIILKWVTRWQDITRKNWEWGLMTGGFFYEYCNTCYIPYFVTNNSSGTLIRGDNLYRFYGVSILMLQELHFWNLMSLNGWLTIFLVYLFTKRLSFCLSNSLVIYYLLMRVLDLQSVWRLVLDEHGTFWKGNTQLSLLQRQWSCWWPSFQNRKNQPQKWITSA